MRIASRALAPLALLVVLTLAPDPAQAAVALDGRVLSIWWVLPFLGILLSIATGPLFYPHVWEHHYGKIAAVWALLVIVPLWLFFGFKTALDALSAVVFLEYMSFIILLFALFTIAGGVLVRGELPGTPATNVAILAIGGLLASFVGTTGASMIMIRPIIRANQNRRHNVHVVIFFIFLVSNIGGALTPLGDPPLFVGFLRGVDFFWTTTHLLAETAFAFGIVIAVFYALDTWLYRREFGGTAKPMRSDRISIAGAVNIVLLGGVIGAVLMSGIWRPGVAIPIPGGYVPLESITRDGILVVLAALSVALTAKEVREANGFNWEPIKEVAKLFAAIFICIVPVIAILRAGSEGLAAPLVAIVSNADGSPNNQVYFWLTGTLSAFLDNAPTYLVFFELAGGDPQRLMTVMAGTLMAISTGAVYLGAMTYIGNAPNFMVYAIARNMGIRMPSFFGYMAWSVPILLPVFAATAWLFIP